MGSRTKYPSLKNKDRSFQRPNKSDLPNQLAYQIIPLPWILPQKQKSSSHEEDHESSNSGPAEELNPDMHQENPAWNMCPRSPRGLKTLRHVFEH